MEKGIGVPSPSARGECILPVQIDHRRWSASPNATRAADRGTARVQRLESDDRTRSAPVLQHRPLRCAQDQGWIASRQRRVLQQRRSRRTRPTTRSPSTRQPTPEARPSSCRRRRQPSCPDATRGRALAMGRSEGSARLGAVDGRRRSAIIDRPASRTRSSGTSRFSAIDFEVGLAQRKLSNRCLRATCSIE